MNKISTIFLCILILQIFSGPSNSSADASAKVTYSNYDTQKSQWTNVSIFPNSYSISSDNLLYDQLQGEFLQSPWDLIVDEIEETDFFSLDISEDEAKIVLQIDYLDKTNTIAFSQNVSGIDTLLGVLDNVHQRITGGYREVYYWPVDVSIAVMESYPEQYGVSAKIQMSNGLFSVVYNENVTLIVADYDIYAQYLVEPNGNITYIDSKKYTIDISGNTAEVRFSTFKGSVDYRPSDLYFFIVLENGMYLKSPPNRSLPITGYSGIDISDFPKANWTKSEYSADKNSDELKLPIVYTWFIIPLFIVPIIRKHYK